MHKALLLLVAVVTSACGTTSDELAIETLVLSPSSFPAATQTTVIASFASQSAYDQVHYVILAPNRAALTQDSFDKQSANFRAPHGLTLPMSIPTAARYTFELWVSAGGAESNHLEAFLTAQ